MTLISQTLIIYFVPVEFSDSGRTKKPRGDALYHPWMNPGLGTVQPTKKGEVQHMTSSKRKTTLGLLLAAVLVLFLIAANCSGRDDPSPDSTPAAVELPADDPDDGDQSSAAEPAEDEPEAEAEASDDDVDAVETDEAEATEEDSEAPQETMAEDEVVETEAEPAPEEMDETPEEEPDLAVLDCQTAQAAVIESQRGASAAHRAHAEAYAAHIEAHESLENVQGSYDAVVEAAVIAEQADAAATRARAAATQACGGVSSDAYHAQAVCAASEMSLSMAERARVDRLAALHDAHNQSVPELAVIGAEVDSAQAAIELAEAEVSRDCPVSD